MEKEWFAQLRGKHESSKVELFYIWEEGCGVCVALKPKLLALMEKQFPAFPVRQVKASEHRLSLAQLGVLTVPLILVLVEEREYYRANGLMSLSEFRERIRPLYEAYYPA